MTGQNTNNLSDAIRNLIVCDTQFGWTGETTLKLPDLLDLQARGWLIEGDDNCEFSLTEEGQAVVARALQHDAPAVLAEQQGDALRERTPADFAIEHAGYLANASTRLLKACGELDSLVMRRDEHDDVDDSDMHAAQDRVDEASDSVRSAIYEFEKRRDRALAATGKQQVGENPAWRDELVREAHARGLMEGLNSPRPQQVGEVQGDGLSRDAGRYRWLREFIDHSPQAIEHLPCSDGDLIDDVIDAAMGDAALAARQPGVQEPVIVEAVGTIKLDDDQEPYIDWLVEGGIHALPVGDVLIAASGATITNDEGYGEVYAAPPAQGIDLGQLPDGWSLRTLATCYQLSDGNQVVANLVGPDAERNAQFLAILIDQRDAAPGVDRG